MRLFKKKEEVLDPYAVQKCNSCNKTTKRKFKEGDYVFKMTDNCISWGNGDLMVDKIFGEVVK